MSEKTAKKLILLIGLAVAAGLILVGFVSGAFAFLPLGCAENAPCEENTAPLVPKPPENGALSVYYIDVGQGDAALLVSPSGKTMLIDVGESMYEGRVKQFLNEAGIEQIDVLIATHSHSDHIGALSGIIEALSVGGYFTTAANIDNEYSSAAEKAFSLKNKTSSIQRLWAGDKVEWDDECTVTVLSPVLGCDYSTTDANDGCLMLRIEYGETAFIFTADATVHAEQLAMFHNEKELFRANVLKVPHHGSTTSSSLGFVEAVCAEYAVISVGDGNPYGHPDFDIVNRLIGAGSSVLRTDELGTIAVFSDGKEITIRSQKTER